MATSSTRIPSASSEPSKAVFFRHLTGDEIRPEMVVKRPDDNVPHRVGNYSGECSKGRHFGSGCYDRIGRWIRIK